MNVNSYPEEEHSWQRAKVLREDYAWYVPRTLRGPVWLEQNEQGKNSI